MRKKTFALSAIFSVGILAVSCGGGGSSIAPSTTELPQVNETEKIATTPLAKEVEVGNSTAITAPDSVEVISDNYTYTKSDTGVAAPATFPTAETLQYNDTAQTDNVTEFAQQNLKPINKIVRSSNNNIALIIDNVNLNKDLTIAVSNYPSLLGLPNNGLDIFAKGALPLATYSFDIKFENDLGKRIWNLKDYLGSDNSFNIYAVLVGNFSEGNYTAFIYDYNNGTIVNSKTITLKEVKPGVYITENPLFSYPEDNIGPVVIAKQDSNIQEVNGIIEGLPPAAVGIIVLQNDKNEIVGIAKISNQAYQGYYYQEPTKAIVISAYLKQPRIIENYQVGEAINVAEDIDTKTFFNYGNATDFDKLLAKYVATAYKNDIQWNTSNIDEIKDLFYPETIESGKDYLIANDSSSLAQDFFEVVNAFISNPGDQPSNLQSLKGKTYVNNTTDSTANSTEICKIQDIVYTSNYLKISVACQYLSTSELSKTIEKTTRTIALKYENTSKVFNISVNKLEEYTDSYNGTVTYYYTDNSQGSWKLIILNSQRVIDDFKGKWTYETKDNSCLEEETCYKHSDSGGEVEEIYYLGDDVYKYIETGTAKNYAYYSNATSKVDFSLAGNYKVVIPLTVTNSSLENFTVEAEKNSGAITLTSFTSTPKVNDLTILNKVLYVKYNPQNDTVYINGYEVPYNNTSDWDILNKLSEIQQQQTVTSELEQPPTPGLTSENATSENATSENATSENGTSTNNTSNLETPPMPTF